MSKPVTTLLHPGEVNRIQDLPHQQSLVVTHTDAPQLYVWNLDTQPDRSGQKGFDAQRSSVPDLTLEGHEENAEFAMAVSSTQQAVVASGGKDTHVLLWDVGDHITSLGTASPSGPAIPGGTLRSRCTLAGHSSTVEDISFLPGSSQMLASVGDDFALLLWDTRGGTSPVQQVAAAHGKHDVHCVDWSQLRDHFLVTGAADASLKVWDRRNLGSPAFTFLHHTEAIMRAEWSPHRAGVFASGAEDRLVCVWDLDARGADALKSRVPAPPQLMFQHAGHKASIVDLQWNPIDPWTVMSVSDDVGGAGGGTLQLWRISDLIYRPDEEVLAELEQYRDYIITGQESKLPSTTTASQPATSQLPEGAAAGEGSAQPSQSLQQERQQSGEGSPSLPAQQQDSGGGDTSGANGSTAAPTAPAVPEGNDMEMQEAQQALKKRKDPLE